MINGQKMWITNGFQVTVSPLKINRVELSIIMMIAGRLDVYAG